MGGKGLSTVLHCEVTSVILVRSLHFSYGLVTVYKVRLHISHRFGLVTKPLFSFGIS